jgi:hypothetical protein
VVDAPLEADQPAEESGSQKTDGDVEELGQARLPVALRPGSAGAGNREHAQARHVDAPTPEKSCMRSSAVPCWRRDPGSCRDRGASFWQQARPLARADSFR